jgi:hypothetical protein
MHVFYFYITFRYGIWHENIHDSLSRLIYKFVYTNYFLLTMHVQGFNVLNHFFQ